MIVPVYEIKRPLLFDDVLKKVNDALSQLEGHPYKFIPCFIRKGNYLMTHPKEGDLLTDSLAVVVKYLLDKGIIRLCCFYDNKQGLITRQNNPTMFKLYREVFKGINNSKTKVKRSIIRISDKKVIRQEYEGLLMVAVEPRVLIEGGDRRVYKMTAVITGYPSSCDLVDCLDKGEFPTSSIFNEYDLLVSFVDNKVVFNTPEAPSDNLKFTESYLINFSLRDLVLLFYEPKLIPYKEKIFGNERKFNTYVITNTDMPTPVKLLLISTPSLINFDGSHLQVVVNSQGLELAENSFSNILFGRKCVGLLRLLEYSDSLWDMLRSIDLNKLGIKRKGDLFKLEGVGKCDSILVKYRDKYLPLFSAHLYSSKKFNSPALLSTALLLGLYKGLVPKQFVSWKNGMLVFKYNSFKIIIRPVNGGSFTHKLFYKELFPMPISPLDYTQTFEVNLNLSEKVVDKIWENY